MLKNILKLDGAQELGKNESEKINGGGTFQLYKCIAPYLINPGDACLPGYHLHPQGHCICCRNF